MIMSSPTVELSLCSYAMTGSQVHTVDLINHQPAAWPSLLLILPCAQDQHRLCMQIAAENAVFGQTGPKVGSFDAGYGSSQMVRLIGSLSVAYPTCNLSSQFVEISGCAPPILCCSGETRLVLHVPSSS